MSEKLPFEFATTVPAMNVQPVVYTYEHRFVSKTPYVQSFYSDIKIVGHALVRVENQGRFAMRGIHPGNLFGEGASIEEAQRDFAGELTSTILLNIDSLYAHEFESRVRGRIEYPTKDEGLIRQWIQLVNPNEVCLTNPRLEIRTTILDSLPKLSFSWVGTKVPG